jgi:hypothetical protein
MKKTKQVPLEEIAILFGDDDDVGIHLLDDSDINAAERKTPSEIC